MRVVSSEIACGFSFETFNQNYESTILFDFQYITPSSHKELLKCIVESFQKQFSLNIKTNALSMSLRWMVQSIEVKLIKFIFC
jgi:hypothetical protein